MLGEARTIPVLDLVGDDPDARGVVHGSRFAASVAHNLRVYLDRFAVSGLSEEAALREGERWHEAIVAQSPLYGAEMDGIAKGAGRTPAEVALLNARYEIAFSLFGRDARKPDGPAAESEGCTTAGLLPEAVASGHTVLVQNWDWLSALRGHCLVLRVMREKLPSFVALTEAGIVGGKMGLNSAGIGLVENGLAGERDGTYAYEKPFHVRCREVLDAKTYHEAILPIVQTRRTASANFVIGSREGEIIDLETSPDVVAPLHPEGGIITHSNHFVDPRHGPSQMERLSPSTLIRGARLRRQLARHQGKLDLELIREALSDHCSHPQGLCRHSDPAQPPVRQTMTLASVVLDLDDHVMWIAEGTPCDTSFSPVALDPSRAPISMQGAAA